MPIYGGGSYTGPREVSYLFVDGGYLREVAQKFGDEFLGGAEPPISFEALGGGFTKCFYYDCLPAQRGGERSQAYESRVSQQRDQLSAIRASRGWHVVEGVIVGRGSRARQKQVDVHIAVDMLTHSYRRNMHRATFIAGDQDFKPLVEAVVREGMFIEIWYEPSSASIDLLDAADARRLLDLYSFYSYVDDSFRELHPIPRRWGTSEPVDARALLERTGECSGHPVELYRGDDGYTMRTPIAPDGGMSDYMAHSDLDLLERVFAATVGEVKWDRARR